LKHVEGAFDIALRHTTFNPLRGYRWKETAEETAAAEQIRTETDKATQMQKQVTEQFRAAVDGSLRQGPSRLSSILSQANGVVPSQ
ncbi:hypothetical protein EV182_008489, partial [Spiromyces aspiralis]